MYIKWWKLRQEKRNEQRRQNTYIELRECAHKNGAHQIKLRKSNAHSPPPTYFNFSDLPITSLHTHRVVYMCFIRASHFLCTMKLCLCVCVCVYVCVQCAMCMLCTFVHVCAQLISLALATLKSNNNISFANHETCVLCTTYL